MKLAKLLKKLSGACFLLGWIPFGIIMYKGPFSMMTSGPEAAARNMSENFFWDMGLWIALAVGLTLACAVFLVASIVVGGLANRRVIATGQDAEARILALSDTGTRINDNPVVDISLEVRPPNYPPFIAQARQTVSLIHLASFQPGSVVHVKYVPGTDQVAIVGAKPQAASV